MMDVRQARQRAEAKLRQVEDSAVPLRLVDGDQPGERDWCWIFPFNSARFLESGDFGDLIPSGPIVVNKDGSDVWIANSAPPVEQWLNLYAAERGYPELPLPETRSPWQS